MDIVPQHKNSLRTDLGFRVEYRIKASGVGAAAACTIPKPLLAVCGGAFKKD